MKNYLCVDNYDELAIIEKVHPELLQAPLILLSDNFSPVKKEEFVQRGYCYFDDKIDSELAAKMADSIHRMLWNWFKDESGRDISMIDGLSLGTTFAGSMEILLNSIIKYEVGLEKILKAGDVVYYASNTNEVFIGVIKELKRRRGIDTKIINVSGSHKVVLFGKNKLKLDPGGRTRDLAPYFQNKLGFTAIHYLLKMFRIIRKKTETKNRALLFPAGKLEEFIGEKKKSEPSKELLWILPVISMKEIANIVLGSRKPDTIYWFICGNRMKDRRIKAVIKGLEKNIHSRITEISCEAMISIVRKKIFEYFTGALSLYKNMVSELKYLRPTLVIICADGMETHYLLAQAAKYVGIKTAILPHGIDDYGYEEVRNGKESIIDMFFAFGKKHVLDELSRKVSSNQIIITSHPYFSKFLPQRQRENVLYKKALILTPDYNNVSPASKQNYFFPFLKDITAMLKGIGIEEMGVKVRGKYEYQAHDIVDERLVIGDVGLRLYAGYTNFREVAKDFDLIIGGSSTALMEAGLIGKDYYVLYNISDYSISSMSRAIEGIVHVAHTIEQLHGNIMNRRIYREGYSIQDLVDLKNVSNVNDLFRKFESAISMAINRG